MGSDLVSACIFCAAFLLGTESAPLGGASSEMVGAYATYQRLFHETGSQGEDASNITPKFVLIGERWVSPASPGQGAGTPRREVRLRLALAPSHDEQEQRQGFSLPRVGATGTGRFENLALLYRQPIGGKDSLELAFVRRSHQATDLVHAGEGSPRSSVERSLAAERQDIALGWRRRFSGAELGAMGRYVTVEGRHRTAGTFHHANGGLLGAGIEGRVARGRWKAAVSAERSSGDLDVLEESDGALQRRFNSRGTLDAYSAAVGLAGEKTDVWFSVTFDRSKLPFVAVSLLGSEQRFFDSSYHPESESRETIWDLSIRRAISPGVRARLMLRAVFGDEEVRLTDRTGLLAPLTLRVRRGGDTGGGYDLLDEVGLPQVSIGLGLEFRITGSP